MDLGKMARMEQQLAEAREMYSLLSNSLYSYYKSLLKSGFDDKQAMVLVARLQSNTMGYTDNGGNK
jgi:hypothetical protein